MTYSLVAVTSWQDVIDEIVTFANARGWTTSPSTIQNPTTGLVTTLTQSGEYLTVQGAGGPAARCRKPHLNGTFPGSPTIIEPVEIHLFGNNTPYQAPDTTPFIAAVVGFGFNNYRHIYIGTMVPAGAYIEGDVVTCNDFSQTYTDIVPYSLYQRYLFRAYQAHVDGSNCGGVKINHADNATTWRKFKSPYTSSLQYYDPYTNLVGDEVFGGNGDGINDGLTYRGHADFASGQVLVPANLYCSDGNAGAGYLIRPLGHVSGVRLIDMENIAPEQQITISTDQWRAFPEFAKRNETLHDWSELGTTTFWPYEYSALYGLAYRENS